jgi:hypothetical protein
MAPLSATSERMLWSAKRAVAAAGPDLARLSAQHLSRRSLKVNDTQKVTLGIIAVYVVVIALLWNLPYIRWSLWPFKVSVTRGCKSGSADRIFATDARYCLS